MGRTASSPTTSPAGDAARRVRARLRQWRPARSSGPTARPCGSPITAPSGSSPTACPCCRTPDADSGEPRTRATTVELERVRDEEFSKLRRASNNSPRGLWSDGDVMYVADQSDEKRLHLQHARRDRRPSGFTVAQRRRHRGVRSPARTEYEAVVSGRGRDADHRRDGGCCSAVRSGRHRPRPTSTRLPDGHQVALEDLTEITVTVTSADGSRTKVYRVRLGPEEAAGPAPEEAAGPAPEEAAGPASCLRGAVNVGFSLVVYAGSKRRGPRGLRRGAGTSRRSTRWTAASTSPTSSVRPEFVNTLASPGCSRTASPRSRL